MIDIRTKRMATGDRELARKLFAMMSEIFEEERQQLSDSYLDWLISQAGFWAVAAFVGEEMVGGITAHTLPMTRTESSELFVYDVAVRADFQRRGIGRHLIRTLRESAATAGISDMFVPADDHDTHALDFYRSLGGEESPVTIFTFSRREV